MMSSVRGPQNLLAALLIWAIIYEFCLGQEKDSTAFTEDYTYNDNFTVNLADFPEQCSKQDNRNFRQWFMPTFYAIICILGLTGNLMVIVTYLYFKRLKTMTDVYLLNLSFADLLFVLSLPLWAANSMVKWELGLYVCKAMHTIYKVTFYSSMFLLSSISIDRYFVISKAVSAHRHRSEAVFFSKISSFVMWLLAVLFSIPEMNYATINNVTCTPFTSKSDKLRVPLQISQIVLAFVIPLLVMGFCYSSIIMTLRQTRGFEKNKAVRVILSVVAVFIVCQVPYNIVLFWTTIVAAKGGTTVCENEKIQDYATDITQCIAFFRCCMNPFVYAFIGVKFRNDVLKLFKDFGCLSQERFFKYTCGKRKSSVPTDTETTTTFSP